MSDDKPREGWQMEGSSSQRRWHYIEGNTSDAKTERWGGRRAQEYVRRTLAEYGDICIICGRPGSDSADHIIPRADVDDEYGDLVPERSHEPGDPSSEVDHG